MFRKLKPFIQKIFDPLAKNLSEIDPNALTILASIPSVLFFFLLVNKLYVLALVTYIGNIFDMLDGAVARTNGKVTAFGGFLDSTLDRVADFFIITAFAFGNIVRWEIAAPLLLFSFLVSYTRSRAELAADGRIKFDVGIIERGERLVLIFIALLMFALFPDFIFYELNAAEIIFVLITILSVFTFVQRILAAHKKLR